MFSLLVKGAKFIRSNPALLVSLFLIVLIPLLVFFLSSYLAQSFQENIDLVLQKEALALQNVLSPYVYDYYQDPEVLQQRIKILIQEKQEISRLKVFVPEINDKFKVVASETEEEINQIISKTSLTLAWHQNQAIAFLSRDKGVRHWNAVRPFYGSQGERAGLISLSLSLGATDELVVQKLKNAYIFALISIVIILVLIIQHTHLFRYVSLFRKMKEVDRAKDSFVNMAVHELRSPVVNMKNYIAETRKKVFSKIEPEEQEDLRRVEVSVNRLNNLISDILDVVKIEQGRLSFVPEIVSPVETIEQVRQELAGKVEERGLSIKFDSRKNREAHISVNPNRLSEILYNLIDNAIKYTQQGEVLLDTKKDDLKGKFYIIIKDTGIGISAEEQQHLFSRFYRIRKRETAEVEGTGLGLWIAKRLCKKMKGEILVESIEGVGTKFIIVFPLIKTEE
jgi:signal transduction histidine kinase